MSDRPRVGPADPETRRKLLREKLAEPTRGEGVAAKETPPAKPKKKGTTLRGLLDPSNARERTVEGNDETISEAVNRGVKMGSEEEKKRR